MRHDKDQLEGLDRKSSRGMLYENEELRLKTININAEVESRQSDIKKLKKENEMLKKGLWYLRDEYDKLERLINDKNIGLSSLSTCSTSDDSESCSSCSQGGESDEVETEQNIQNVQRTNLRNIHEKFEQLSVVTEETSAENSEHGARKSCSPVGEWNDFESNVIQPDQSYPDYSNLDKIKNITTENKLHYFSTNDPMNNFETNCNQIDNEMIYPDYYNTASTLQFQNTPICTSMVQNVEQSDPTNHSRDTLQETFPQELGDKFPSQTNISANEKFYHNVLPRSPVPQTESEIRTMQKSLTDIIVKIDNQNFNKDCILSNTPSQSTFSNGGNLEELLNDIESVSMRNARNDALSRNDRACSAGDSILHNSKIGTNKDETFQQKKESGQTEEKAYTSELNVVLLPNPMPIITFDKYKDLQRSFENVNSIRLDEISISQQDLCHTPIPLPKSRSAEALKTPDSLRIQTAPITQLNTGSTDKEINPFFFGNFKDNYVEGNFFRRYDPNNFLQNEENKKNNIGNKDKSNIKYDSRSNLTENKLEHVSNYVESKKSDTQPIENKNTTQPKENPKSPSLSLRKKVSIHFKGKLRKNNNSDSSAQTANNNEKKSVLDVRFSDTEKNKISHQKTPSIESKKSTTETSFNQEQKTTSSSESKHSNEKKMSISVNRKDHLNDKKNRKSHSVSPERGKHHMHEDGTPKKHKKHKRGDRARLVRPSVVIDPRSLRERSFSVCTDRSVPIGLGLGFGYGSSFTADDHSDRERTNSSSSCDTAENVRKMSTFSNVHLSGKVPWCGCWGNGCL